MEAGEIHGMLNFVPSPTLVLHSFGLGVYAIRSVGVADHDRAAQSLLDSGVVQTPIEYQGDENLTWVIASEGIYPSALEAAQMTQEFQDSLARCIAEASPAFSKRATALLAVLSELSSR